MIRPCKSTETAICSRCLTLEKHGISRRDVFYRDGEYCKQCREEKMIKILKEEPLKALNEIRRKYGKSSKGINKSTK